MRSRTASMKRATSVILAGGPEGVGRERRWWRTGRRFLPAKAHGARQEFHQRRRLAAGAHEAVEEIGRAGIALGEARGRGETQALQICGEWMLGVVAARHALEAIALVVA